MNCITLRPLRSGLLLAVLVLLFAGCVQSEPTLLLTGVVTDSISGNPIRGATVSDNGYGAQPPRSAQTDSLGRYSYQTWPEEHNILAEAQGYKSRRATLLVSLLGNDTLKEVNFALAPE